MNIEHIKLFVRLAATNNITLAGHGLGISPAVASSYINKLEASINARLVHRTTRRVSLTQEGIAFLPYAQTILDNVSLAKTAVGANNLIARGNLKVSAPASFGRMHLIPAMKKFMQTHPDLTIDYTLSDSMVDIIDGGFDLAIRNASLKDSSLIARKIAHDRRIVCASPKYLRKFGKPIHPTDLLEHDIIHLNYMDKWIFNTTHENITIKPKGKLKADNGEAIRDACVHGMGITIMSTWCCFEQLKRGLLVPILTNYPLYSDTAIWALYPNSRLLAPKIRSFIDFFSQYFGEIPYWDQKLGL